MVEAESTLFGYELPFPREDLYVACAAVLGFIPAVVLINAVVNGLLSLLGVGRKAKAQ